MNDAEQKPCDVLPPTFDGSCATCGKYALTLQHKDAPLDPPSKYPHPVHGPMLRDIYICPDGHKTSVLHYEGEVT